MKEGSRLGVKVIKPLFLMKHFYHASLYFEVCHTSRQKLIKSEFAASIGLRDTNHFSIIKVADLHFSGDTSGKLCGA